MNRIEKLIAELCPDGVEWRKLGEVCEIIMGTSPEGKTISSNSTNGIEFHQGKLFFGNKFLKHSNLFTTSPIKIAKPGSILMSVRAPVGDTNITDRAVAIGRGLCSILGQSSTQTQFIYYYLKAFVNIIKRKSTGSTFEAINKNDVISLPIPIPPLPIQEEIVKILDTFTALEAELELKLQAELEARKKQYEYYRNKLLTPVEHNGRWYLNGKEVEWKKLGEVCGLITTGKLNANAMEENGIYPFFTCDEKPYRINTYAFDLEAILISGNGSKVGHLNYYKGKFNAYQRTYVLGLFSELIRPMFLFHFLKGHLKNYIFINSRKGSVPYITLPMLQNFPIPIPPLSEQERIVAILDKFDALVNDLTSGLPAEIEARRKQYEYYRNKLLQFPPFQKC